MIALAACGGRETDVLRIEQEIESVDASIGAVTEMVWAILTKMRLIWFRMPMPETMLSL